MFADEATEQGSGSPREWEAVPRVAPADTVEIRVETRRRVVKDWLLDANGVHAVAQPALKAEQLVVECAGLIVQRDCQRVGEPQWFDAECGVGTGRVRGR